MRGVVCSGPVRGKGRVALDAEVPETVAAGGVDAGPVAGAGSVMGAINRAPTVWVDAGAETIGTKGSVKLKAAPRPRPGDSAQILPPCASIVARTTASPKPLPTGRSA